MSFQAMTWATEQELKANEKIVLVMLANRCNHDTGRCDPAHKRLARECGRRSGPYRVWAWAAGSQELPRGGEPHLRSAWLD